MSFYFLQRVLSFRGESDVWFEAPTLRGIVLYSFVTPVLCCGGLAGNVLILWLLKRKELVGSMYVYLSVLACVDLMMSVVLILGGISRGVMWWHGWVKYDSLIGLPLGGLLNTLGVLATVGLTVDRVIYLWNPVQCTKPKFCDPWMAKRLMLGSLMVAIFFNLPYCFIYRWNKNGNLATTSFFDSGFYMALNWITLFLFAVFPTIILLFGNGFLIMSLRMAKKIDQKANECRTKRCKRRDHTNLTITLVMIIIFFLITNIPGTLVSRTAAINLLFQGDHNKAKTEIIENLRQICTILGALDVNANFIFYYTFCPAFCKALKKICKCKKRRSSNNLQVNVFVLNANRTNNTTKAAEDVCFNKKVQKALELSRKSLESAFTFHLGDIKDKETNKGDCKYLPNCDFISVTPGEYVEIENDYTPPFSTITEESSTNSTNLGHK